MLVAISELILEFWIVFYRIQAFVLLNLIDDPAILAMVFC